MVFPNYVIAALEEENLITPILKCMGNEVPFMKDKLIKVTSYEVLRNYVLPIRNQLIYYLNLDISFNWIDSPYL